jgi:hypothetical protein
MPIPKPRPGENQNEFVTRCMDDEKMKSEYPSTQRYPVCKASWDRSRNEFQDTHNDYPDAVVNNAKRGIELNDKIGNKCATQVGKVRAQQLSNREKISIETIKRMYSYLSRAEVYYDNGTPEDCGYISYLLWGGKAAKDWAQSKINDHNNG